MIPISPSASIALSTCLRDMLVGFTLLLLLRQSDAFCLICRKLILLFILRQQCLSTLCKVWLADQLHPIQL